MGLITIGVDIGKKHDPTAVAVAEIDYRPTGRHNALEAYHVIRRLERLPLGTPYPGIATRLEEIVINTRKRATTRPPTPPATVFDTTTTSYRAVPTAAAMELVAIYVDATGVGASIADMLAAAALGVPLYAVYFTYGDRRTVKEKREISLGKAWLVSRLQALLQTGRILLPKTAEAEALAKELLDYEIKVDQDANEKYGAFSTGAHDDLVTALGLATQVEPQPQGMPVAGGGLSPLVAAAYERYRRYS